MLGALQDSSEKQIMDSIIDLLRYERYMVWRNNVGVAPWVNKYGENKVVRFGRAGMSDIFAISPQGRFIAIEVKKPSTRTMVSPAQQAFIDEVNQQNGIAFVAWNIEMVAERLGIKLLF